MKNNISPHIITLTTEPEVSKQSSERVLIDLTECQKIAVIGDIHGTLKFIEGYEHILKHNDDVNKIVVLGDHFDPYGSVDFKTMVERYNTFISCMKMDDRIVSILGNHDLSKYIIETDETNRSSKDEYEIETIRNLISENLKDSRLMFVVGNCIFSHAGVSYDWVNMVTSNGYDFKKLCKKGWSVDELCSIVSYYDYDFSGWGNHPNQGPTWIRPMMLAKYPYGDFRQVVGHTMMCVEENRKFCFKNTEFDCVLDNCFYKTTMSNGKDLWFVDNAGNSEYFIITI